MRAGTPNPANQPLNIDMSCARIKRLIRVLILTTAVVGLTSAAVVGRSIADASHFPTAGTYKLQRIFKAPNSWVLEHSRWWPQSLSKFTSGKVTLLSFFYSTCRDPQGCPVVWSTFESVHADVQEREDLHGKVRLVLISLDPRIDTPQQLEFFSLARRATQKIAPWHFLTTWSDHYIGDILDRFGQAAGRDLDANGNLQLTISHQIKFFLIDESSWVREIYAGGFADPAVIENDIRTLLMEAGKLPRQVSEKQ